MEAQRVIEKFKKELPEFNWEDYLENSIEGNYFVITITAFEGRIFAPSFLIEKDKYSDISDGIEFNSEEELDTFIQKVHKWMKDCDSLKGSDRNEDQIVFLDIEHDENRLPCFLKDFKYIIDEESYYGMGLLHGIGVINSQIWDFSKKELLKTIHDSTDGFLIIEPYDIEKDKYKICEGEEELIEEFYNQHPEAREIKEIYVTSCWD